jgi:Excreted virulence factor EspC, type VII ESX diderm
LPHARFFEVDLDALHRVAGTFDGVADGLASAVSRFTTAAQPHADAFGLLPAARSAHGRYLASAQSGEQGLHRVHHAFQHTLAGGLRATAANYRRADHDSRVAG